jgi:hypothetical protein
VSPLAFGTVGLVALSLLAYIAAGEVRLRFRRRGRPRPARKAATLDPGAERRAERRARSLLKSVVNRDEWEMYRDLGFIRVLGRDPDEGPGAPSRGYGYLIYPHKPIVAYLTPSNSLLSEYCVEFPDPGEALHGPKLPDSDDVLAKWLMIKADEERLIRGANMHLPGRQVDPQRVRRDLWRLAEWERARRGRTANGRAAVRRDDAPADAAVPVQLPPPPAPMGPARV